MNLLFEAGLEFQRFFKKEKWPFCFIGGLAVIRWGEPRMTQDIDASILSGLGNELLYIEKLLKHFKSRIPNAEDFALKNRVLLLFASNGVGVDISLSALPFEKKMMDRASLFSFSQGCSLLTCSAEDLIILKAFADRGKDWSDIETIIIRHGKSLNFKHIYKNLRPLCEAKQAPEIVEKLKNVVREQLG